MATGKKFLVSESELKYLADIIRDITGTSNKLSFPDGFISAINLINMSS